MQPQSVELDSVLSEPPEYLFSLFECNGLIARRSPARSKLDELVDNHIDTVQYVQDILHLDIERLSKVGRREMLATAQP